MHSDAPDRGLSVQQEGRQDDNATAIGGRSQDEPGSDDKPGAAKVTFPTEQNCAPARANRYGCSESRCDPTYIHE